MNEADTLLEFEDRIEYLIKCKGCGDTETSRDGEDILAQDVYDADWRFVGGEILCKTCRRAK